MNKPIYRFTPDWIFVSLNSNHVECIRIDMIWLWSFYKNEAGSIVYKNPENKKHNGFASKETLRYWIRHVRWHSGKLSMKIEYQFELNPCSYTVKIILKENTAIYESYHQDKWINSVFGTVCNRWYWHRLNGPAYISSSGAIGYWEHNIPQTRR